MNQSRSIDTADIEAPALEDPDAAMLTWVLGHAQARTVLTSFTAQERSTENIKFLCSIREIASYLQVWVVFPLPLSAVGFFTDHEACFFVVCSAMI